MVGSKGFRGNIIIKKKKTRSNHFSQFKVEVSNMISYRQGKRKSVPGPGCIKELEIIRLHTITVVTWPKALNKNGNTKRPRKNPSFLQMEGIADLRVLYLIIRGFML